MDGLFRRAVGSVEAVVKDKEALHGELSWRAALLGNAAMGLRRYAEDLREGKVRESSPRAARAAPRR
ncbi:hypothetical protein GCM10009550_14220 [Actinocorallia libanotica]|uniref:Uncharacterized protein n=1 Tax=Actinocorallia libanotica TaxID=46162 RepID=A0ABP4AXM3_9ACTN